MEEQGINFSAIPQTAIKVITSPAAFYRGMPKKGGFGDPLVFMLVTGAVTGILQAVFSLLGLRLAQGAAAGMAAVIYVPVAVLVGGFIGAAILFVIWKLMGSQEDYETAYRCGAYASAFSPIIAVLGLVPYAGMAAGTVIWVYLLVVASVEVHHIMPARAWLVFGIIGIFFIIMGITSEMTARKLAGQMNSNSAVRLQRQVDMEGAALAGFAVHGGAAAMRLGDGLDYGEPQAGAFHAFLTCVIFVERLLLLFFRHAGAGIQYGYCHVWALPPAFFAGAASRPDHHLPAGPGIINRVLD